MRIGAVILGIVGGIINAIFGALWIFGAAMAGAINRGAAAEVVDAGAAQAQGTAGYLLVAGLVAGIAGGVLAAKGKGRVAAGVMILAALAPAVLVPKALGISVVLLAGGLLALGAKPRASQSATLETPALAGR